MRTPSRLRLLQLSLTLFVLASTANAQLTQVCSVPGTPIPDNDLVTGASDTINIAASGTIMEMTVDVRISHTWIGDVIVELEHVSTGTRVILMERPGLGTRTGCCGCDAADMDCTFDDMATMPVETQCSLAAPAIGGTLTPEQPLAGFVGEDIMGDWTLQVFDGAAGDTGTILEWCINYNAGPPAPVCTVTAPMGTVAGPVDIAVDAMSQAMPPDVTLSLQWSPAGMAMFTPCTMTASSPNPNPLAATPAGMYMFQWDAAVDGAGTAMMETIDLEVTVVDANGMSVCTTTVDVDNRVSCTATAPGGVSSGDVTIDVAEMTTSMPPNVDLTFEWSPAGVGTFQACTAGAGSPTANPELGVPAGMRQFVWDSRADGVAMLGQESIDFRVTVADATAMSTCVATFDVDNTSLCGTVCGDCDGNGSGPDILDALNAAQIAAGLIMPTMSQQGCCDTNSSGGIDVLDALTMAQAAAGLTVTLTCP